MGGRETTSQNGRVGMCVFLRWNKTLFGHLLAQTLHFGIIDTPVSMNWDGGPVKRAAEGMHHDKDVWPEWIWYIPSRALLYSFLIL